MRSKRAARGQPTALPLLLSGSVPLRRADAVRGSLSAAPPGWADRAAGPELDRLPLAAARTGSNSARQSRWPGMIVPLRPTAAGGGHRAAGRVPSGVFGWRTRSRSSSPRRCGWGSEPACPFAAGYWTFLERNAERLRGNHRMRESLRGLDRLMDLDELVVQGHERGDVPPP